MRIISCVIFAMSMLALATESEVALRQQFRRNLREQGVVETCRRGLSSADAEIRKNSLAHLYAELGEKACPMAEKAISDSDSRMRILAVRILSRHLTPQRRQMIQELADTDPVNMVRFQARHELWPFYRKNILLKNEPSWDFLVKVLQTESLSASGCSWKADAEQKGHLEEWYKRDYDDSTWEKDISALSGLQAGGACWGRLHFNVSQMPSNAHAFELFFSASGDWDVWLNGIYLGNSSANPEKGGFRLDGTREVVAGGENILVFRCAGGKKSPDCSGSIQIQWLE